MHYIRIVRLIIFCLLLPLAVQAKREKVDMPDKPMVSDSILQCIFQFSPFYSRIIDEYKADLYIKGKVKEFKGGTVKAGEKTETEIVISCLAYKVTLDGKEIINIDKLGFKSSINGVDQAKRFQSLLS